MVLKRKRNYFEVINSKRKDQTGEVRLAVYLLSCDLIDYGRLGAVEQAFPDLTLGLVAMKSMEGLLHPQHRRVSAVEQLLRRTLLLQPLFEDDLNSISSVLECE